MSMSVEIDDVKRPWRENAKAEEPSGDVRLIARAAAILRALTVQPRGASLGDLAKATGIPRSTVQRLVNALEAERLVTTSPRQPGVRLGGELCRMAAFVEGDARDTLRPHAGRLLERFQESVDITFWDNDAPVIIETFPSPKALRATLHVGLRFPLHCTACGKAHMSLLDPARQRELLAAPLTRYTARTMVDPEEVLAEIEASAIRGYFLDRSEFTDGLSAVAVTLDEPSLSEFGLSIAAPTARFEAGFDAFVEKLLETRAAIGAPSRRLSPHRK